MGLFGNKNEKLLRDVMKQSNATPQRKTVTCPKCGRKYTATFVGPRDSYTCKDCNYRIYAN